MTDLEQWLSAQGLEQYSKHFADNDIDFEVLGDLTVTDLEKLGMSLAIVGSSCARSTSGAANPSHSRLQAHRNLVRF
jgi:hypothetical protein